MTMKRSTKNLPINFSINEIEMNEWTNERTGEWADERLNEESK